MGLFADDEQQDQRIEALELHVRKLTQALQDTQTDLATSWIALMSLRAAVDAKVSTEDVDPTLIKLNEELGTAREQLAEASAAASENWAKLQEDSQEAIDKLRVSVSEAFDRLKNA